MTEKEKEQLRKLFNGFVISNRKNTDGSDFVLSCVYKAYDDAKRTFRGVDQDAKEKSLRGFCSEVEAWFDDPQEDFAEWHEQACELLQNWFPMTMGQAQKIVNMTFKYMYSTAVLGVETGFVSGSIDEKYKAEEKYKDCHVALDGYILRWMKEHGGKTQKGIDSWSKIDKYEKYCDVQKELKDILEEEFAGFSPFKAEYYIWQRQMFTETARAFFEALESTTESRSADSAYYEKFFAQYEGIIEAFSKN